MCSVIDELGRATVEFLMQLHRDFVDVLLVHKVGLHDRRFDLCSTTPRAIGSMMPIDALELDDLLRRAKWRSGKAQFAPAPPQGRPLRVIANATSVAITSRFERRTNIGALPPCLRSGPLDEPDPVRTGKR